MGDAAGGAGEPVDPEIAGVPLSAYAAVLAYTAEGVSLEASLEHAAIAAGAWPPAEEAWSERLAGSAMGDGALLAACDEHRLAAQAHVERKVPPLDTDLRAWLDFFRAFTASEDPLGFLEARGLGEGDVFRLLGAWQERIVAEGGVRAEATAILAAAPGPVPEVRPEAPVLRASTRRPRGGGAAAVKKARAVVGMPLETADLPRDLSKLILPFVKQPGGAQRAEPPAPAARSGPGLLPALAVPELPKPVLAQKEIAETAPAFPAPSRPALPFGARAGEGVEVSSGLPAAGLPPLREGALEESIAGTPGVGTAPVMFEAVKPALPFAPSPGGPSSAAPPSSGGSARSPAADGPRLSLEDYAAMLAEIAASPATATAAIARYGLTREAKSAEDAAWQARFAAEPGLRMKWMRALVEAGERVRGKR
ncbi:hypothetical protein WME95_40475 [Sorangium sp. So ce327]|jgi:hypothetical protein|uniref:hypothetical protein n=1 Tax=unclassified Sorangium TaxID=2621164 RepID=UPI003F632D16